jgi:acetyltransferase
MLPGGNLGEPLRIVEASELATSTDPSHDLSRRARHALDAVFHPRSIAIVGASEKPSSVGNTLVVNLTRGGFTGQVYLVNPKHDRLCGQPCYRSVAAIPDAIDLAIIATPALTVPGVIRECVGKDVRGAVVISAGFKEHGEQGKRLEQEISSILKGSDLRVIGPNCLGIMVPSIGLNATFAQEIALRGKIAFASQSGALLTAILDWSKKERVGFSSFVSTGSMLDVDWGDLIFYLGDDPETEAILLYMESIGDARSFLSAAREVALAKPIIVIKAGRTEAASRAAASHTGALTGSDDVLDAAFRRCGVLRVNSISDLFAMAEVLGKQPRPKGPKLMIVSNAGGPAVLATDALIGSGGELATVSPDSLVRLETFLPEHWSHNNPIDILGDADPTRYARTLEVASQDANADGLLVILAPQGMTDPLHAAETVVPYAACGKTVLASWMGGSNIAPAEALLNEKGIPTFPFPDTAARIFSHMWNFTYNLRGLYETPIAGAQAVPAGGRAGAEQLLRAILQSGRTLLTEAESKDLLQWYGIPVAKTAVAASADAAVDAARAIGFPVVLKLLSATITHKSDVGGVKLDLKDEVQVRSAFEDIQSRITAKFGPQAFSGATVQPMIRSDGFELILGSSVDSQFGPVLLFGTGGKLVEVFRDRALGLPPLNSTLARRMMERTKVWKALHGVRGSQPVDLAALEQLLARFSQLVVAHPRIKEIDINPLLASSDGLIALDARVVLHDRGVSEGELPRPAIRPYPDQYVKRIALSDGTALRMRPIRPEDETAMVRFHQALSEDSVYHRFSTSLSLDSRTAHERLSRICFIDYEREIALVVEREGLVGEAGEIVGVGRLSRLHEHQPAEIGMLVSDAFQRRGLGALVLQELIHVARQEGAPELSAHLLARNSAMRKLAARAGFVFDGEAPAGMLHARLSLQ